MTKNCSRFMLALAVTVICCFRLSGQQPALVEALSVAFASKEVEKLHALISPDFTVGVYNRPTADKMLRTILDQYSPDSLHAGEKNRDAGNEKSTLTFFQKGKPTTTVAHFDEQGKLLSVDLFDELFGVFKNGKSELKARFPFEVVDGSIIVTARLNKSNRPLRLLFDTGADGLALNAAIADSIGIIITRQQNTAVVGGSMNVPVSSGNTLHINDFSIPGNSIAIFKNFGHDVDGILGNTICKKYITKVDFNNQQIELYNFGDYTFEKEGTTLHIRMPESVPVVPASVLVGEKEAAGNFVFDTGAGYYVIGFGPFVKNNLLLVKGFKPYYTGSTVSMGHATTSFTGNFTRLDIGTHQLSNLPGVLQAYTRGSESLQSVSGSIGIKTWQRYNFTLDLSRQQIHLTPNKNDKLPLDFVLRSAYLTFNSKGQLLVESVIKGETEVHLNPGDIILSINDIKANDLISHPEKIRQLQALGEAQNKMQVTLLRSGAQQLETL